METEVKSLMLHTGGDIDKGSCIIVTFFSLAPELSVAAYL
jgi:hypothetical protein